MKLASTSKPASNNKCLARKEGKRMYLVATSLGAGCWEITWYSNAFASKKESPAPSADQLMLASQSISIFLAELQHFRRNHGHAIRLIGIVREIILVVVFCRIKNV